MSERLACKAAGLAHCTYRRTPIALTPADPDADLQQWLRTYCSGHPCHGFRRAWAVLRHDEHRGGIRKKVQPLVERRGPAAASAQLTQAGRHVVGAAGGRGCAENVVGLGFPVRLHHRRHGDQDRVDARRATRESLLNIAERSITADRLIEELHTCFATAGEPPLVLRTDNGPEFISQALQSFCAGQVGLCYIPPETPWNPTQLKLALPACFAPTVVIENSANQMRSEVVCAVEFSASPVVDVAAVHAEGCFG